MDDADTLECKYECTCGIGTFRVRYRRQDEDPVAWMENAIGPAMTAAHYTNAPTCDATGAVLFIPFNKNAKAIGMRVVN